MVATRSTNRDAFKESRRCSAKPAHAPGMTRPGAARGSRSRKTRCATRSYVLQRPRSVGASGPSSSNRLHNCSRSLASKKESTTWLIVLWRSAPPSGDIRQVVPKHLRMSSSERARSGRAHSSRWYRPILAAPPNQPPSSALTQSVHAWQDFGGHLVGGAIFCRMRVVHFAVPGTSSLHRCCPSSRGSNRQTFIFAGRHRCVLLGGRTQRRRPGGPSTRTRTASDSWGPLSVGVAPAGCWWGSRARRVWGSGRPSPCALAARILARRQAGRR